MYLVSALLTFGIQCRRILSLLHLSTASKDVLINIRPMHIYVTVLNTDIGFICHLRRAVYRSTGLHGPKDDDDDDDDDDEKKSYNDHTTSCVPVLWYTLQFQFQSQMSRASWPEFTAILCENAHNHADYSSAQWALPPSSATRRAQFSQNLATYLRAVLIKSGCECCLSQASKSLKQLP